MQRVMSPVWAASSSMTSRLPGPPGASALDDGAQVDLDGAPDDLYNRVTILWTDWRGRRRSKTFKANPAVYPDVAGIKGVQKTGMLEKGKQADQTPHSVLGTDVPKRPQQR